MTPEKQPTPTPGQGEGQRMKAEIADPASTKSAPSQTLIAAASAALPIGELEAQAFGTRHAWGTHARPGRIEARTRAIRVLVRAAESAMEARPSLELRHVEAAVRSLALSPSDLLVCGITGKWLSSRTAVAHRGREIARAIEELALIVQSIEAEGGTHHG